jgi:hypothetical protein
MPTLATNYNWGNALRNENADLMKQLSDVYKSIALCMNTKVSKYVSDASDPPANSDFNRNWEIGDLYVRKDTDTAWIMTSRTDSNNVVWTQIT